MDQRRELSNAVSQIINCLSAAGTATADLDNQYTLQTLALRLEVLTETALHEAIRTTIRVRLFGGSFLLKKSCDIFLLKT